jgi:hypothetical protein
MANDAHNKAAEHHENAAKAHGVSLLWQRRRSVPQAAHSRAFFKLS